METQILKSLPPQLAERTRLLPGGRESPRDGFVLYWLHHAMRARENPALDVAVTISNEYRLPLLVYQAIPEREPYASDRHHMFMLEGARDLQRQFRDRGIRYALLVERQGQPGGYLSGLCDRAVVTITEEMPVDPLRNWTELLASRASTPILSVDTACVLPMQLVDRAYDRAFEFRTATHALREERLNQTWTDVEPDVRPADLDLPFEPLCLLTNDLSSLVAECEIDHSIGPVPHTRGGPSAGYARWDAFKGSGLSSYAKRRNNPLVDGASRLSPYFHYGMISPLRIAREAAEAEANGSEKYLDELLIWRELAYAFCFHNRSYGNFHALPKWARETLAAHESDRRPAILSWETLARGKTGDNLWDAAQQSLLLHGELHNNVRMTWGKALANWTPDARAALATMIDLNHRYALDGRDPASYGGILWCLGQFDRPFPPARPILGTVRGRSTEEHARRLDPDRYWQQTTRPLYTPRPRVAVIGAGISGLMCARTLLDHGIDVTVVEKGRGVGGRMSTRRTDDGLQFDHGAQYFTVRDERFERYVDSWLQDGIVARWEGRICTLTNGRVEWKQKETARYVGVPGMNAICRHLSADLSVRFRTHVNAPERGGRYWHLTDLNGEPLGEFDFVITSAPAPQSAELLAAAPDLQRMARGTTMNGCWAVLLGFDRPLGLPFDGAFVNESPLSWISKNSSKPQRGDDFESWVLHASPEWTGGKMEADREEVLRQLTDAFFRATDSDLHASHFATAHRWRYAIPPEPLVNRCLFDPELWLGGCGDWCSGPRVEGAFLSGAAIAGRVLSALAVTQRQLSST